MAVVVVAREVGVLWAEVVEVVGAAVGLRVPAGASLLRPPSCEWDSPATVEVEKNRRRPCPNVLVVDMTGDSRRSRSGRVVVVLLRVRVVVTGGYTAIVVVVVVVAAVVVAVVVV